MALTRNQKKNAIDLYQGLYKKSNNLCVVVWKSIPVVEYNKIRMMLDDVGSTAKVIKKRLFLKTFEDTISWIEISKVDWVLMSITSWSQDDYAWLKVINTINKKFKKEWKPYKFDYIWWIFDKTWKDWEYISWLATLPSKEESLSKFLYLLKYPIQSIAIAFDKIREKKESQTK